MSAEKNGKNELLRNKVYLMDGEESLWKRKDVCGRNNKSGLCWYKKMLRTICCVVLYL